MIIIILINDNNIDYDNNDNDKLIKIRIISIALIAYILIFRNYPKYIVETCYIAQIIIIITFIKSKTYV